MKVVIVNCFDTYEDRVLLLRDYFVSRGASVRVVASDYCHFKKEYRTEFPKGFIPVHAAKYEKNLSPARIASHERFAGDAMKLVGKLRPHLLWVLAPPNLLAQKAAAYKKKNRNVRLIIDMIDMWPETMPVSKIKHLPPFQIWKDIRDRSIGKADLVFTECELYRKVLKDRCEEGQLRALYLAKRYGEDKVIPETSGSDMSEDYAEYAPEDMAEDGSDIFSEKLPEDRWSLCYLGSVNNIIDIDCIADIIRKLPKRQKKPLLNIIGDGERKEELISSSIAAGAEVRYHGKIYDENVKKRIFDSCHFGLNIMKKDVFVGLTMKSIDYFAAGLPVINNIGGDTGRLVRRYGIGINFNGEFSVPENEGEKSFYDPGMRENVKKLYEEKFTVSAFENRLDKVLEERGMRCPLKA